MSVQSQRVREKIVILRPHLHATIFKYTTKISKCHRIIYLKLKCKWPIETNAQQLNETAMKKKITWTEKNGIFFSLPFHSTRRPKSQVITSEKRKSCNHFVYVVKSWKLANKKKKYVGSFNLTTLQRRIDFILRSFLFQKEEIHLSIHFDD